MEERTSRGHGLPDFDNPAGEPGFSEVIKAKLRELSPRAVERLGELLDSGDERIQLEAAKAILDRYLDRPVIQAALPIRNAEPILLGKQAAKEQDCSRAYEPRGAIDEINEQAQVCGWAYDQRDAPVTLSVYYDGLDCGLVVADVYRSDLEAAGIGSGRHAFFFPLPCPARTFDPALLQVCFNDGSSLPGGSAFHAWNEVDLLSSPVTRAVTIEFTTRCNLRCIYCPVSLPDYVNRDFQIEDLDSLVAQLLERKVQIVNVNGHGETTVVRDWHRRVSTLLDAGFIVTIITNSARLLRPEELAAMARMATITISIDTHEERLLREIRRNVKLSNILKNMRAIEAAADELKIRRPLFKWSCVVSDRVALRIEDYVRFAIEHGVKHFVFCNLVEHERLQEETRAKNVLSLSREHLMEFSSSLAEAKSAIHDVGGSFIIAGDLDELIQVTATEACL